MNWLLSEVIQLIGIAVILFFIAALLSPLEALGWWAGWDKRWPGLTTLPTGPTVVKPASTSPTRYYLVYLTGLGSPDPQLLIEKELNFLSMLEQRLPGAVIIRDIFPYSVTNDALFGRRYLAPFWRFIRLLVERGRLALLHYIIFARNLFQVAVSADRRYGPIYSFGVAREVTQALIKAGYRLRDAQPVILIGLSGGAQIAVGCAPILNRLLGTPIDIISIGGVLTDDPGILEVNHLLHLSGSRDKVQHLGAILYPGRWPIFPLSAWGRAVRQGRITVVDVGPIRHMAYGDYFSRSSHLPSGESHVERTVAVIVDYVQSKT